MTATIYYFTLQDELMPVQSCRLHHNVNLWFNLTGKTQMDPPFHHVAAVSSRLFNQHNLWRYRQRPPEIDGQTGNGETCSYAKPRPGWPRP